MALEYDPAGHGTQAGGEVAPAVPVGRRNRSSLLLTPPLSQHVSVSLILRTCLVGVRPRGTFRACRRPCQAPPHQQFNRPMVLPEMRVSALPNSTSAHPCTTTPSSCGPRLSRENPLEKDKHYFLSAESPELHPTYQIDRVRFTYVQCDERSARSSRVEKNYK